MDIWRIILAIVLGGPVLVMGIVYLISAIFFTAKFDEILFKDYIERKNR